MEVSIEKPGSPAELVHFGKKGMKWGVRKAPERSGTIGQSPKSGMSTKKKVAIGVGAAAVVAGAAATVYLLHKNGHLPISPLSNRHPTEIGKIIEQHGGARPSRFKVSRRELKRFHRLAAQDRAARVRMNSLMLQAMRNKSV